MSCGWCTALNYQELGTPNARCTYICWMHRARSLANVYYWNQVYKKNNENKAFPLYLEKEHNYPPQQIDSIMNKYVDVYISALGVDPKVKAETTKEFKVFSAATIVMLENCKSFN
jgi:hypothetical protein